MNIWTGRCETDERSAEDFSREDIWLFWDFLKLDYRNTNCIIVYSIVLQPTF